MILGGRLFVAAALLVGCAAEAPAGDQTVPPPSELGTTSSAIATATSGAEYATVCKNNQVPLPPWWGVRNIGVAGGWTSRGHFSNGYTGFSGNVYTATSSTPPGLCALVAHDLAGGDTGLFDVLCQGSNGKACFWEGQRPQTPPAAGVILADPCCNNIDPWVLGGQALADVAGATRCTDCHAGETAFIIHNDITHPLQKANLSGWRPTSWYQPIVASGWLMNPSPPQTTSYPASCLGCHAAGGQGHALPTLSLPGFGNGHFCDILFEITGRSGIDGGMPPTISCLPGSNCARDSDPAVKTMLAACGMPNPRLPTITRITPPGIGPAATKVHASQGHAGVHQHYFYNATTTMPNAGCCTGQQSHPVIALGDTLNVSIWIPGGDKPREVMIQVWDGIKWSRVFWGEDLMAFGPRKNMGALPATNSWQTLTFKGQDLGLPGTTKLNGMAFTLYDGSAYWADALFRSSDPGLNSQWVSQVWVRDGVPAGATLAADGGDFWDWRPFFP
jgi:hypothetical protein